MSFYEDFIDEHKRQSADGYSGDIVHDEVADELAADQVHYDILDTTRWGEVVEYVYERDGEFVSVVYERASGDGETVYSPTITEVVPVEVTVVQYKTKT